MDKSKEETTIFDVEYYDVNWKKNKTTIECTSDMVEIVHDMKSVMKGD